MPMAVALRKAPQAVVVPPRMATRDYLAKLGWG